MMKRPPSHLEQAPVSSAFTFQRMSLAACIILAPLSITLYLVSWAGNQREPLIYIIGHLLSAVFIGYMLGRLRLVPAWAAWAFALTSPLTILLFPVHNIVFQDVLKYLICALWIIGAIPAALAMLRHKDLAPPAPFPA